MKGTVPGLSLPWDREQPGAQTQRDPNGEQRVQAMRRRSGQVHARILWRPGLDLVPANHRSTDQGSDVSTDRFLTHRLPEHRRPMPWMICTNRSPSSNASPRAARAPAPVSSVQLGTLGRSRASDRRRVDLIRRAADELSLPLGQRRRRRRDQRQGPRRRRRRLHRKQARCHGASPRSADGCGAAGPSRRTPGLAGAGGTTGDRHPRFGCRSPSPGHAA